MCENNPRKAIVVCVSGKPTNSSQRKPEPTNGKAKKTKEKTRGLSCFLAFCGGWLKIWEERERERERDNV